jgi:hypothetical protein
MNFLFPQKFLRLRMRNKTAILLCLLCTSSQLLAREPARQHCNQTKDCLAGQICAIEHVPCATNPTASSCVQKVCGADPAKKIQASAYLETGPDDSMGMRLQFSENSKGEIVWTTLHGNDWQRALRGQMKVNTIVRVCTRYGTPASKCVMLPGRIEFSEPVPKRAGLLIQGVLWFQEQALAFATTLKDGRIP